MLALALCVAALAPEGLPSSFTGLWYDREDNVYLVAAPATVEYISGEQWGVIAGIYQAPDGGYVGKWAQSKNLAGTGQGSSGSAFYRHRDNWPRTWYEEQYAPYKDAKAEFAGIVQADNAGYYGEFKMKLLGGGNAATRSGSQYTMSNSRGSLAQNGSLYYLGDYAKVTVDGKYADKYFEANIVEEWGETEWTTSGTFTYRDRKLNAKGGRLMTRGRLDLIDPTNGRSVGYAYYGYYPTPAQVRKFRDGQWEPADRLLINFAMKDGTTPTVQRVFLMRK